MSDELKKILDATCDCSMCSSRFCDLDYWKLEQLTKLCLRIMSENEALDKNLSIERAANVELDKEISSLETELTRLRAALEKLGE